MASLGAGGSFVLGAETAGYSFDTLISRILDVAHHRCFGAPAMPDTHPADIGVPDETQSDFIPIPSDDEYSQDSQPNFTTRTYAQTAAALAAGHSVPSPHKVTRFYDEQIRRSGYYEQLRRIVEPSPDELRNTGVLDTSGERENTRLKGLQHKYPQTVLLLVTDQCFFYCRFCFRKRFVGRSSQEVVQDYRKVADYVGAHPEITDILLSGGDPFVLDTQQLNEIIDHFLPIPHVTSIRFGTKAMVHSPSRFSDKGLDDLFERIMIAQKVLTIVTHIDHFGEVSDESESVVGRLRDSGVRFLNQTVLLRGVNDTPETLAATFRTLHRLGIRPYYLFQARPVLGASHFQVPLRQGIDIVRDVDRRLSGTAKAYRYVMSHYKGKIEILGIGEDNRLWMRYHQAADPRDVGMIFSQPYVDGACWLDDLPCPLEVR